MSDTESTVLATIKAYTGQRADVRTEDRLEDLGIDSLDRVELAIELEERLDIEIDDDAIEQVTTVGDLIKALEGNPDGVHV
jgi:acyl carrier protein